MKKIASLLLVLLMITVLFTGCNAADSVAPEYNSGSDLFYPEKGESMDGSVNLGSGTSSNTPELDSEDYEAKIIKKYQITAETKAFDDVLKKLETLISENGGYIESSKINGRNLNSNKYASRYATYTLRIPAKNVEIFI